MNKKLLYSLFAQLIVFITNGQTTVNGRVVDAQTQEPIAFANIVFTGSTLGTTSNFEGYYTISSTEVFDSISVIFLGYHKRTKAVEQGTTQEINFQLESAEFKLDAIDILPGENPAHKILRKVWDNKTKHDIRNLESFDYESYTKVQVDVDNISDKFKNRKVMKPFGYLFDSLEIAAGEDGQSVLPVFISETLSDYYFKAKPYQKKEVIKATHVTGVGMEDGSYISQFVGSSFHDYNFYKNNITILEHNVVSPISNEAIGFYIHILEDSMYLGNKWCYQIKLVPKREEDMVFNGTMWIQDTTFALVKLSVEVVGTANLNFVDRYKIQQELAPTNTGAWVPIKTRILMDVAQPTNESFGMLAKVYISNKNVEVNREYAEKFFKDDLLVKPEAIIKNDSFWVESRHDKLSSDDLKVYAMVDTIRNFPRVKTYIDLAKILAGGYIKITPKVEFGSYLLTYGTNVVEQHRFRAGFRTTGALSKRFTLKAYGAYGLKDQRFKYGSIAEVFLNRENWTKIGYQYKNDLEGLGASYDYEDLNPLMEAATQLGLLQRLNRVQVNRIWFHTDLHRSVTQKVIFTSKFQSPEGDFVFAYYPDFNKRSLTANDIRITELAFETRWSPFETKLVNGNRRSRLNVNKAPAFTFRYSLGLKDVFGGDFAYQKLDLRMEQIARLGIVGRGEYIINYSKTFTPLPYTLLNIYPGNETFIRTLGTYNMMNFFEFVADESLMLFYVHHFDGVVMNRIPLMRKLKWRLVLSGKVAMGSLSEQNMDYIADFDANGLPVTQVKSLVPNEPYYEIGYGFENIFRFVRLQAYHRLSYLNEETSNFGIKGSVYFNF
ncbi:MAG: carboxypeptidase-like regulatory domain-containing protein [Bacteroidia bacterium]